MNNLRIFKDHEGIIRVRTRLLLSNEPESFVNPVFLKSKHIIIVRLVIHKHNLLNHAGSNTLISNLREKYWITGVRKLVKSVISQCVICKRYNSKSAQTISPPLPLDRVKPAAVFEVTGIDLAGPLFLLSGEKVWIVLYTCAIYRAIHLELTRSLSTEAFLMTLRRFIARRGRVEIIYTDNATNFHGAHNQLQSLDWNEIQEYSSIRNIKWNFNPPAAPWWGGWWERLVRTVKELLRRNLGKNTVTYEELQTLLCDCETIINSRPLTYIADDTEKLKPLTPACFLYGLSGGDVSDLDKIDETNLNRRLRYIQKVREGIRIRFRNEYLSMLIHNGKQKVIKNLKSGDVVLIETEDKRSNWPLGVIIETYIGRDGEARVAKIKTSRGEFVRPIQRLYPLEVSQNDIPKETRTTKAPKVTPIVKDDELNDKEVRTTRYGRVVKAPKKMNL